MITPMYNTHVIVLLYDKQDLYSSIRNQTCIYIHQYTLQNESEENPNGADDDERGRGAGEMMKWEQK